MNSPKAPMLCLFGLVAFLLPLTASYFFAYSDSGTIYEAATGEHHLTTTTLGTNPANLLLSTSVQVGEMATSTASIPPIATYIYTGGADVNLNQQMVGLLSHVYWLIDRASIGGTRSIVRNGNEQGFFDKQIESTTDDINDSIRNTRSSLSSDIDDLNERLRLAEDDLSNLSIAAASTSVMVANLTLNGNWLSGDGADEGLFVNGGGFVGVGTSTPTSLLSVAGDLYLAGALRDGTNNAGTVGMVLQSNGASTRWVATSTLGITGGGGSSLFTDAGATTYLTSVGDNLAIGTTTAGSKLTVEGDLRVSGGINFGAETIISRVNGNLMFGSLAMLNASNLDVYNNISIGDFAGHSFASGWSNIFIGRDAGQLIATGSRSVIIGNEAVGNGYGTVSGGEMVVIGDRAGYNMQSGGGRGVFLGFRAGENVTTGNGNTLLGFRAGDNITDGYGNIVIGYDLEAQSASQFQTLNIGNLIFGTGLDGNGTILSTGNVGIGTSTPGSKLTVAGDLRVTGALRDSTNNAGTAGMVLQTTGSGTQWVATSTLGFAAGGATTFLSLTDTPGSFTANRIMFTNSGGDALVDSADLTFDGTNIGLGTSTGIAISGVRIITASTTNDSLFLGTNAGGSNISPYNTFIGARAGASSSDGSNTFIGTETGQNSSGWHNFFVGQSAGGQQAGSNNVFLGNSAASMSSGQANIAIGQNVGQNNVGNYNNLFGYEAGYFNRGSDVTLIGRGAGYRNEGNGTIAIGYQAVGTTTASSTGGVIAIGEQALFNNTTGYFNNAVGYRSLLSNTTGIGNVAYGARTLENLVTGNSNIAIGNEALRFVTSGGGSVAIGANALRNSTAAFPNTAVGTSALTNNTSGIVNTAVGDTALGANTTGSSNVAMGTWSLLRNTTGGNNVAIGNVALGANLSGSTNVAIGRDTLANIISGNSNVAIGFEAGLSATSSASNNIFVGYRAGDNVTTGNGNLIIGYNIDAFSATGNNNLNIGNLIFGTGVDGTGTTLSSGNVGIGTTTPTSRLSVVGDFYLSGALRDGVNASGTQGMVLQTTGTSTRWVATSTLGFGSSSLFTDAGATTYLTATGDNLAIGTTTAVSKLTVDGEVTVYGGVDLALGEAYMIGGSSILRRYASPFINNTNLFIGSEASSINTASAYANTAVGTFTLRDLTTGQGNAALGAFALENLTTGGSNTAVGNNSLSAVTTGGANTALGLGAGGSLASGNDNSFFGRFSGGNLATSTGSVLIGEGAGQGSADYAASRLTVIGQSAGRNITTGSNNNILIGYQAADNLTTGANNLVIGYDVDIASSTGSNQLNIGNLIFGTGVDGTGTTLSSGNVGIGTTTPSARLTVAGNVSVRGNLDLPATVSGGTSGVISVDGDRFIHSYTLDGSVYQNIFMGIDAGNFTLGSSTNSDLGIRNIGIGQVALNDLTTGRDNIAIGDRALTANTTGDSNVAIGTESLRQTTTGGGNTAVGRWTMDRNTTGSSNSAFGFTALFNNTSGGSNVAIGRGSLNSNSTGSNNTALGWGAADNLTTGSNNLIIGYNIDAVSSTSNNTLNIGNIIFGTGINGEGTTLSSGNVGIGTVTPTAKLTVAGDVLLSGAGSGLVTTNDEQLVLEQTGDSFGATRLILQNRSGSNGALFQNTTTGAAADVIDFGFQTANGTQQNIRYEARSFETEGLNDYEIKIGPSSDVDNSWTFLTGNAFSGFQGLVGIGTTTPSSELTVAGDIFVTGAIRDSVNSVGTAGMILQTNGTSTRWVATSTLGFAAGGATTFLSLTDTPGSFTTNRVLFTTGSAVTDSANFTFNGADLSVGNNGRIVLNNNELSFNPGSSTITIGRDASFGDTGSGGLNLGIGSFVFRDITTGHSNVAIGVGSAGPGRNLTTGTGNVLIGNSFTGTDITSGIGNTFVGSRNAYSLTTGNANSLFGNDAGHQLTGANFGSSMFGSGAGFQATSSANSVIIGHNAGYGAALYSAQRLTLIGDQAGRNIITGSDNSTFFGYRAGANVSSGANNLLLGYQAADNLTTGANNLVIGYDVDIASTTGSNQLNIGNLIFGTGVDGTGTTISSGNIGIGTTTPSERLTVVGTIQSTDLFGGTTNLVTDANGNIIRETSDARLKENVTTIENALDTVLALRGVRYEWINKERFGDDFEIGFLAQEVDEVVPEVVQKGGDYWALNSKNLVAVVVEAIKEVWAKVLGHEERLVELETENELLKSRLESIERELDIETVPDTPPPATPVVEEEPESDVVPEATGAMEDPTEEEGAGNEDEETEVVESEEDIELEVEPVEEIEEPEPETVSEEAADDVSVEEGE